MVYGQVYSPTIFFFFLSIVVRGNTHNNKGCLHFCLVQSSLTITTMKKPTLYPW